MLCYYNLYSVYVPEPRVSSRPIYARTVSERRRYVGENASPRCADDTTSAWLLGAGRGGLFGLRNVGRIGRVETRVEASKDFLRRATPRETVAAAATEIERSFRSCDIGREIFASERGQRSGTLHEISRVAVTRRRELPRRPARLLGRCA